jgi:hypothetical protein
MIVQVLPDVSDWNFNGTYEMRGKQANLWVYEQRCVSVPGAPVCIRKFPQAVETLLLKEFLQALEEDTRWIRGRPGTCNVNDRIMVIR